MASALLAADVCSGGGGIGVRSGIKIPNDGATEQALRKVEEHIGRGEKAEALRLLGASVATDTPA